MPHPIWVRRVLWVKFISHSGEKHIPHRYDKAPEEQWDNLGDEHCCATNQQAYGPSNLFPHPQAKRIPRIRLWARSLCYTAPMHFLEPAWPSSLDTGTSTTSLGELSTAPRIRAAGCLTWPEASHKDNVVLLLVFSRIKRKNMLSKVLRYMPQASRPSCTVSNALFSFSHLY